MEMNFSLFLKLNKGDVFFMILHVLMTGRHF
jgi:hypothetical protein